MAENEKQATFTGAQQRDGICALPFAVDGLFGLGRPKPKGGSNALSDLEAARIAAAHIAELENDEHVFPVLACSGTKRKHGKRAKAKGESVESQDSGDDETAAAKLAPAFEFDWVAYRAAYGDTPVQDAVTAMFSEYASLYSMLCRQVGSAAAPPLTLLEAKALDVKATRFVNEFATPLLGVINTTKIHRLLRHVLDAVRCHGNVSNGNTSSNESQHKEDKPYYMRTNRGFDTFTGQIVRHAQGTREILASHERAERDRAARADVVPGNHEGNLTAEGGYDSDKELDSMLAESWPVLAAQDSAPVGAHHPNLSGHVVRHTVGQLSQRPGLAGLGGLLGKRDAETVSVLSCTRITARLGGGIELPQLLRASPSFHNSEWYDAVAFEMTGDASGTCRTGELRAIVREDGAHFGVVCELQVVSGVVDCPLVQRGCQRLRWAVPGDGSDWQLRKVPVERILRMVHVVPDFGHMLRTLGNEVVPPPISAPARVLRGMRYFVNHFYRWG